MLLANTLGGLVVAFFGVLLIALVGVNVLWHVFGGLLALWLDAWEKMTGRSLVQGFWVGLLVIPVFVYLICWGFYLICWGYVAFWEASTGRKF